jgi:uncharacterized membrane protein HdeD (DUF308 family)
MKRSIQDSWSLLMFNGLIALLYGILAIFASEALIITIVTYFGILILVAGVAMAYGVYTNFKNRLPYGFDLLQSIVVIILGVLLTFFSRQSLQIFVLIIGVWALLLGGVQLYYSFNLPEGYNGKTSFIINSLVTIVFGVVLLFNPFETAAFMVILSGVLALIVGVIMIVASLKLKNFRIDIND